MSRKLPFHSYSGAEPYLFVSYAHKDEAQVFPMIRALHERLCRIWYDEGIEIGVNWPQTVAERLRDSALVLVFLSKNALASQNCLREIHFSVSQKKTLLVVRLDDSELPAGIGMQVSVADSLDWRGAQESAEDVFRLLDERVLGDGVTGYEARRVKTRRAVNGWLIAALALSLVLGSATLYLLGRLEGWFGTAPGVERQTVQTLSRGEVTVTRFSSKTSLELMLRAMDSRAVYLCGNALVSDALAIEHGAQGFTLGGEAVERGMLDELDLFADMELEELALVRQSLESLEGVEVLATLRYLDLSDNPLCNLSALAALEELETLRILCLPAGVSLAPLTALPHLREVVVSYDMVDRIEPLLDEGIDVTVKR